MVIQVNGKVRDRIDVDAGTPRTSRRAALASAKVIDALGGATPKRVVVRPPRLVNVVPNAATGGSLAKRRMPRTFEPVATHKAGASIPALEVHGISLGRAVGSPPVMGHTRI